MGSLRHHLKALLKQVTPPVALQAARHLRNRFLDATQEEIEYDYDGFSLRLPVGHMLPAYREQSRLYDAFLPHLAAFLEPGARVIDVGANCGDSLASMAMRNSRLQYLCIEPDPRFFAYLTWNIERLQACYPQLRVDTAQRLIGKMVDNAALQGNQSSNQAIPGKGDTRSITLDELLSEYRVVPAALVKSDVDGFDYDVLLSGWRTLSEQRPLVFFECQYHTPEQKAGYELVISRMQAIGYSDWCVFDNFGQLMLRTDDVETLDHLLHYVWNQNIDRAMRTIYYFDILAASTNHERLISKTLEEYLAL